MRGLTNGAETQISTFSPKRKHLTRFGWRRPPSQMNHQGRPRPSAKLPELPKRNQMAQTLSLPSSLPVGPEPQCYWNMILDGRDLDAFTWFSRLQANKWKDSYQAAGRKLPWNLHAEIMQFPFIKIYIFWQEARFVACSFRALRSQPLQSVAGIGSLLKNLQFII